MFLGADLAAMGSPEDPGEDTMTLSGPSLAFAGGDGSASNPFQITNVFELQNMSANVTAHYILNNDIDATATFGWNAGAGLLPVGNTTSMFNGTLDGNGHTISGLTIDRAVEDYVGLFGYLEEARVHNLTVSSIDIKGRHRVGGLCGQSITGSIENCTVVGSVEGVDYVGGIVGAVSGDVKDCQASATVSGEESVGGLAGYSSAAMTRCASDQKVTGSYRRVGGLVGNIAGGTVSDSHSDGDVDLNGGWYSYETGGFAGYSAGTISSSYSTGSVAGTPIGASPERFGGFIGHNRGAVSNCHSLGSVSVLVNSVYGDYSQEVGGFVGYNAGTVNYSFAKGSATVSTTTNGQGMNHCRYVGGFVGNNRGTISYSYSTGPSRGSVTDDSNAMVYGVGGFSGVNYRTISNCYSTGSATAVASGTYVWVFSIGGMVGYQAGAISHCYSTGSASSIVIGTDRTTRSIGGFIGAADRASTSCFWDTDSSGTTRATGRGTSSGISGNSTSEMMTRMTFEDANWDFNDTWVIIENLTYPCLNGMYQRPVIDIYDHQMVVEDLPVTVSYDVSISDYPRQNQEKRVVITSNASAWLTWNETTRSFRGTPTNSEVGSYWLNISAEDLCGGIGWNNVTLDVLNVNDPPVITTDDVVIASEDTLYSIDYEAIDVDPTNDTLTWNMSTLAEWLTLNTITGRLSGTPTNDHVGAYQVSIDVTDGNGGLDARSFTLVVENINDDPTITSTNVETSVEDEGYSVYYHATDVDPTGDVLTWTVVTDTGWLMMTENNLHGMPTNDDVGTHWVNVTVFDGKGGIDSTNFTVTVTNVNDPPVITTEDVTVATEDQVYSVEYGSEDVDPTTNTATWRMETEAGWLRINQDTGVVSGTPTNDDVGSYLVTVSVLDGKGGSDARTFMLTVENTNDDPEITTTPPDRTKEDLMYSHFLEATDVDPTRDTLTWSLDTDAEWLSLDGNVLSGVPTNDDVGEHRVNVTVEDGMGGSASIEFTLTVLNTNDPPVIVGMPSHAREDEAYSFTMEATDEDEEDSLEWSMETSAGWLSIDTYSGEMTGTPDNSDVGSHFVMIVVTDGRSEANKGFTIMVTNTNDVPEWLYVPEDVTVEKGASLSLGALAEDMDGDMVSYAITSEPVAEGLSIGVTSGDIVWYETRVGTYQVTVTASDGEAEAEHTFTLTVEKAPETEEEGMGNAPFYLVIAVLLVLVVILVLKMMMGGGEPAPVSGIEEEPVEDEPVDGAEEEATDKPEDEPKDE